MRAKALIPLIIFAAAVSMAGWSPQQLSWLRVAHEPAAVTAYLYTTGSASDGVHVRKYDLDGTLVWSLMGDAGAHGVAVDAAGDIYTAGAVVNNASAFRHDQSGNLLWSTNHGAMVRGGIVLDSAGNIYTAGDRASDITTRRYDAAGNLIWSRDHGADVWGIVLCPSGYIYTSGVRTGGVTTRKYDLDGTEITSGEWPIDDGVNCTDVFLDSAGNVYTTSSGSINVRKYDPDGSLLGSASHGTTLWGGGGDEHGNIYVGGDVAGGVTTRKYDSSMTEITDANWPVSHGGRVRFIRTDKKNNVYTAGNRANNLTTRKYDPDGAELWAVDHGNTVTRFFLAE